MRTVNARLKPAGRCGHRIVDPRELAVELLDVAAETPAERAAEQPHPFEVLGADAVVIDGHPLDLRRIEPMAIFIDRFVGLKTLVPRLNGGVSRAVGTDDDFGIPLERSLVTVRRRSALHPAVAHAAKIRAFEPHGLRCRERHRRRFALLERHFLNPKILHSSRAWRPRLFKVN